MDQPQYSVVAPLYNEKETATDLHRRLVHCLNRTGNAYEIILVDDGSTDGTWQELQKLQGVRRIRLLRNYGQTAALSVGIKEARGNIIITMDGDLENDPADIPILLMKMDEGFDIISGWRKDRWQDKFFTRRLPSAIANRLISCVTGVWLHDHGCALKAYRAEVLKRIPLTGDMHRMIAAYAARHGARVAELPVRFEPRKHGISKYGFSRTFKVLLDILAFHFFYTYARRPVHFFGAMGFLSFFIAGIAGVWAVYLRVAEEIHFIRTPLPIVVAIFIVVGFQFILMGLLAEITSRSFSSNIEYDEET
jgi:glycosyltransferase involved in cell wall biosynthesis